MVRLLILPRVQEGAIVARRVTVPIGGEGTRPPTRPVHASVAAGCRVPRWCAVDESFHAPLIAVAVVRRDIVVLRSPAPKFVNLGDGESCVGSDFLCVPADEPVNHHVDHEIKFPLLPPVEHVDHFPQHNHQVLNFVLREIFDSLSTLMAHRKAVVRSIALKIAV